MWNDKDGYDPRFLQKQEVPFDKLWRMAHTAVNGRDQTPEEDLAITTLANLGETLSLDDKAILKSQLSALVKAGAWEETAKGLYHPIGLGDGSWINLQFGFAQTHEDLLEDLSKNPKCYSVSLTLMAKNRIRSLKDAQLHIERLEKQRQQLQRCHF